MDEDDWRVDVKNELSSVGSLNDDLETPFLLKSPKARKSICPACVVM